MKLVSAANWLLRNFDARLVRASTLAPSREQYKFWHAQPKGYPVLEFHVPEFMVTEEDLEVTRRVVNAFHSAFEKENTLRSSERPAGDLWEMIGKKSHAEFLGLLVEREITAIAEVLVNALHNQVSYGLCEDNNRLTYERACSPKEAPGLATLIADRLVNFAEALGIVNVEFPEWGRWGSNIYLDLAEICDQIEQATGITLSIPDCFGSFGVQAGKHVIPYMAPAHAYAAWRVLELLNRNENAIVCEIGGGYGGCAYYCTQQPLRRYIIIDLPVVNVLQAFFLIKTCGPESVCLYNEDEEERPIHILPYWMITDIPDGYLDLTLNQTSLPEIDRTVASNYIAEIARATHGCFLSINQESAGNVGFQGFSHNTVSDLVNAHGGFQRQYRFLSWIRKGEVEECYRIVRS